MNKTLTDKLHHILQHQKPFTPPPQQNLPLISLNQLESKFNHFKRKNQSKQNLTQHLTNHKEINVCSPFYDRMKTHKQNCKCPYHRKQRFTILPVRHTDKTSAFRVNQVHRRTSFEKQDLSRRKNRNGSYFFKKSSSHKDNTQQDSKPHSQTQPLNFQNKAYGNDYSCEQFMKDCDYFMLNKKGFSLGKSNHVIRKGVKEIFEFIKKHLDYSVKKMSSWINSVEKDKDYGEFYVERFKEMKINYQTHRNKHIIKTATTSSFGHLLNRTQKLNSEKLKFNNSASNLSKPHPSRYKKSTPRNINQSQQSQQQCESSSSDHSSNCLSNDSELSLDKIVSQLKLKSKISQKTSQKIMKKGLNSFKQLFSDLQDNILNQQYSDDLLQKFDNDFFQSLIKKYANNKSIKHIQTKIEILTKTHEALKKYRKRSNESLNKTNQSDTFSKSRGFIGSKRNTQTGQLSKTSNSLYSHSKKLSDNCSLEGSQTDLNDKFHSIQEDQNEIDEDGIHGQKNGINLSQGNVRRSKLLKEDQFDLDQIRASYASNSDCSDRDFQRQRQNAHKGFFTRAQKFLFDCNMGKAIVKKEDSIFTMKRKVRVIKVLLKENSNSAESNELRQYIKAIEHKVFIKTQNKKRKTTILSSAELISDEEIWKLVSLDNLGFNLIFYDLSSKILAEDNEDLCILLNEIKINGIKKLENHVTYKTNFRSQEEAQKTKKNDKKAKQEDIFVQDGMGNMHFEPKIEQQSQKDLQKTQRSAKTRKTRVQNFKDLTKMLKTSSINDAFKHEFNFDLDDMDEDDMQLNYQKIKRILKYAKIHLPETFDKYLKSSSIYTTSQMNSFMEP